MADNNKSKDQKKGFDSYFDLAWNTLKSMKFAIILLVILAIATTINLFANEFIVPVNGGADQARMTYDQAYGGLRADILFYLQMYSPYRSWWYTTLLTVLTLSLLVCAIDRFPNVWRQSFRPQFPQSVTSVNCMSTYREVNGKAGIYDKLKSGLKKKGYQVWDDKTEDATRLNAKKFGFAYFGSWLVHVGFILLIIGGALIARGEYRSSAQGLPGQLLAPDESWWGFNVRVDSFKVEYYDLLPGQYVQIKKIDMPDSSGTVAVDTMMIGEITALNDNGLFEVDVYVPIRGHLSNVQPDFLSNRIDTRMGGSRLDMTNISDYIATLTVIDDGKEVKTERVEVNYPLRYKGYRFYQSSFNDMRTDAEGNWTTILSVRHDRGAPFVWAGILAVSLGLVFGMYFVPRTIRAWVFLEEKGESIHICVSSKRNKSITAEEFDKFIDQLEK